MLRYEKRTKEHPLKLAGAKNFTVKEETIDDALLAAELLRKTQGIDPKRVFIIGHSQGAMMAPRMALADQKLAGIAMLAAPSRPLEIVMFEQTENALKKRDQLADAEIKLLEALNSIAKLIKDGQLKPDTPPTKLFGLTPAYWQSLCGPGIVTDAQKLQLPIIILQGEADDQVTMTDFAGWQKEMAGRKNVTLKSYPGLIHTFTPNANPEVTSHVLRAVVEDLAAWITARP